MTDKDPDFTEIAEALSLLASLVAAGIAMWEEKKSEAGEEVTAEEEPAKAKDLTKIVWVLAAVVTIQFLLLLFLVYKIG